MENNTLLIVCCSLLIIVAVVIIYLAKRMKKSQFEDEQLTTFAQILDHVKEKLFELDKDDYELTLSSEEFQRAYRRKTRISEALANCVHGIDSAKVIVIDLIRTIIAEDVKPEVITKLLQLSDPEVLPPPNIQFEALLYKYKKQYGKEALTQLIRKSSLDLRRDDKTAAYYITENDLATIYALEGTEMTNMSIEEQTELLAILIYQKYKGFGIIDTIREMNIDGINIGTSGALIPQIKQKMPPEFRVENSVWIFFGGKQIHLRFLSFENEDEIRRIVMALIRFGGKGALTRNVGKMITTAPDKARITALCPPASECWSVFIRKFGFSGKSPEELVIKPYTVNGDLPVELLEILMQSMVTCAVTGRQGSGKTTLMTSLISYIDPCYTIRTLEMAFEMYLRDTYPERNILAVQETATVPANVLQDTLKKTDGSVSIVGEVATDDVAARMIQMGQVASLFTLFSHHANTAEDLVLALRNSLVNAGGFSDMTTAERQVLDVLSVDIHLTASASGERYIERITEIIALPPGIPYPEYTDSDSMNRITKEYYQRVTDRRSFFIRDIIAYDLDTHTYKACNWFSDELYTKMLNSVERETREKIIRFRERWFA